jgi:hypothetical protein
MCRHWQLVHEAMLEAMDEKIALLAADLKKKTDSENATLLTRTKVAKSSVEKLLVEIEKLN